MEALRIVDRMVAGSNPAANIFNFLCKIEIFVEGDGRTFRFMVKQMSDFVQLMSATL